jgi:hypothetical protein
MKRLLFAGLIVAISAAAPAGAATLYVGHGIPGKALGLADNLLPVDVCLVTPAGSSALFKGVTFGNFAKVPLDLPAGRYDVEVRLADNGSCKSTVALAASIFLGLGENATAIAHLTEQGTPTLTKFVNDVRPLGDGMSRIWARHTAAAGAVDVFLRNKSGDDEGRQIRIRDLENPEQKGADLGAGRWWVAIAAVSSLRQPLFKATVNLEAGKAYFAYAVGAPSTSTFTVLLQQLDVH